MKILLHFILMILAQNLVLKCLCWSKMETKPSHSIFSHSFKRKILANTLAMAPTWKTRLSISRMIMAKVSFLISLQRDLRTHPWNSCGASPNCFREQDLICKIIKFYYFSEIKNGPYESHKANQLITVLDVPVRQSLRFLPPDVNRILYFEATGIGKEYQK